MIACDSTPLVRALPSALPFPLRFHFCMGFVCATLQYVFCIGDVVGPMDACTPFKMNECDGLVG